MGASSACRIFSSLRGFGSSPRRPFSPSCLIACLRVSVNRCGRARVCDCVCASVGARARVCVCACTVYVCGLPSDSHVGRSRSLGFLHVGPFGQLFAFLARSCNRRGRLRIRQLACGGCLGFKACAHRLRVHGMIASSSQFFGCRRVALHGVSPSQSGRRSSRGLWRRSAWPCYVCCRSASSRSACRGRPHQPSPPHCPA